MARTPDNQTELLDENGDAAIGAIVLTPEDGDHAYAELMRGNFLRYSMSVITDRALPDVRDGLKPVHRRILQAARDEKLSATSSFRKSAKVVGTCMGTYHPHGDLSIYDAMVLLAQPWATRVMLIDGHGNFGSIDGDRAGAPRYTEARLTRAADAMLADMHPEILPEHYGRNYDESREEALVLPAPYPNLLVNGGQGIAVGMSTNILPHNPTEIMDLTLWRLANPDASVEKVAKRLTGPDLPTGGVIVRDAGLEASYLTGSGKVTVRARAHVEPIAGNREQIVITEIPYQTNKAALLQKIAFFFSQGKFPEFSEMNDYSDEQIRIVIELKRGTNANAALKRLFKLTDLRKSYGVQMRALLDGQPKIFNLAEILDEFLSFRRKIVVNRARKRINEIEQRLYRLDALIKALDAIDEVVKLLRAAKDTETARDGLVRLLKIEVDQARFILEMPLRSLTKLSQHDLREEVKTLRVELKELQKLIKTPALVTDAVRGELTETRKLIASPRVSAFLDGADDEEDFAQGEAAPPVDAEDCVLYLSAQGNALCGLGTLRKGGRLQTSGQDTVVHVEETSTDQDRLVFTQTGKAFRLRLAELPLESKRHKGRPITQIVSLSSDDKVIAAHPFRETGEALFVYRSGTVKRTSWSEFTSAHSGGVVAAKPGDGDELIAVLDCPDEATVVLVGSHGKAIRWQASDARPMGRVANGVVGIKLPAGASVCGAFVSRDEAAEQMLLITSKKLAKRIPLNEFPTQGRGGGGVATGAVNEKLGEPAAAFLVHEKDDLAIDDGDKLRFEPVKGATKAGRAIIPKAWTVLSEGRPMSVFEAAS